MLLSQTLSSIHAKDSIQIPRIWFVSSYRDMNKQTHVGRIRYVVRTKKTYMQMSE